MTEFCVLWAVSSAMVQFCLHLQALALHYSITLTLCSVGSHSAHYCGRLPGHFGSLATQEAYLWRELPQVSFLSWRKTCFVTTKVCLQHQSFCHDRYLYKSFLSRQASFCCDKRCVMSWPTCIWLDKSKLVATKLLLQQIFVMTKVLSQQKFCRDRHTFVLKDVFCVCCDKNDTCGNSHQW